MFDQNEYNRHYYENNKDRINANSKQYYENHRDQYHKNKDQYAKKVKEYRRNLKIKLINAYGAKCVCCGEKTIEFLTVDHINGNGNKHKISINCKNGSKFYVWLIKNNFPKEFRLLCMNCNFSLGHYGYCPHGDMKQETHLGKKRSD